MITVFFLSLQFYFLAVLFNFLAGLILCSEYIKEKIPAFTGLIQFLDSKETKFVIGVITLIAGIFKLIVPLGIVIIGDFIPAVASVGLGLALLMDFFKESTTINSDTIEKLDSLLLSNKNRIGGLGLLIAVIHFFFAGVPVLL